MQADGYPNRHRRYGGGTVGGSMLAALNPPAVLATWLVSVISEIIMARTKALPQRDA